MQLQTKMSETESHQREVVQLKFKAEQMQSELDKSKQDVLAKDISLQHYNELAELNKELNARNIEMVTERNNLQSKLEMIEQQEKEMNALRKELQDMTLKKDNMLAMLKQKMLEAKTMAEKHDLEMKLAVQKSNEAIAQAQSGGFNSSTERHQILQVID